MLTVKSLFIAIALVSFTACHIEPAEPIRMPTDAEVEQYNASVPPEKRIVCREENPVETYISRRVCRLVADLENESKLTRSELMRFLR